MSGMYKRQRRQFIFAAAVGAIAIVNVLFFLILHRPARADYFRLQSSSDTLRNEAVAKRADLTRMERLATQLETSDQDRRALYTAHFIEREAGYAEILPILDRLAGQTGVRKSRVDYAAEPLPEYSLYSLKIRLPVQGAYSNIVRFMQELETADTFFIIDSIDVRSDVPDNSFQQSSGSISLFLNMETFFYQ